MLLLSSSPTALRAGIPTRSSSLTILSLCPRLPILLRRVSLVIGLSRRRMTILSCLHIARVLPGSIVFAVRGLVRCLSTSNLPPPPTNTTQRYPDGWLAILTETELRLLGNSEILESTNCPSSIVRYQNVTKCSPSTTQSVRIVGIQSCPNLTESF